MLDRLERRFGRFAIVNVTAILIAGQVLLFMMHLMQGPAGENQYANVKLIPAAVFAGEVWRLITFLFVPPATSPIFLFFAWYLLYLFGTALEQYWGAFRYNVYLLIGYVANVSAAFLAWRLTGQPIPASNAFLFSTLFLAFARLNPDFTLLLFFILPIRIRWLALLMWLTLGWQLLTPSSSWMVRLLIVASVMNYLLFFGREHWRQLHQGQRRRAFQSKTVQAARRLVHECRICGNNSDQSPKTLFRYCSKCAGQCCYCPEHIGDHEHLLEPDETVASSGA
jgi:hypothetical protein